MPRVWRLNRARAGNFLPSTCSMDADDDALQLGDIRSAAKRYESVGNTSSGHGDWWDYLFQGRRIPVRSPPKSALRGSCEQGFS